MQYYAKTNTAHPLTGFISVGEYLTDKQVEALGADLVADMVARGVLAASGEIPEAAPPSPTDTHGQEEETFPDHDDEEADETDGDEDELPELDMTWDIVTDQPASAAPAPKKGGRRKPE